MKIIPFPCLQILNTTIIFGNNKGHTLRALCAYKVSKGAKIRNRYNQVPHLTQHTNGKVTNYSRHHKREPRGQSFYPGTGIMEGDCTHNPEDRNNKSIK